MINTLLISQSENTINLLKKFLGFSGVQEGHIYTAKTKEDLEILTVTYDFDLIFSEGFENYLKEIDLSTIRLLSRKGSSTLSKLDDSYITKPIEIRTIQAITKVIRQELLTAQ